jgi:hypothetical protein
MTRDSTTAPLPSTRTLAITTMAALVLAVVILITTVLPAEYGFDPLGTGGALGLTAIARPVVVEQPAAPEGATALKPVSSGPMAQYAAGFKIDSVTFTLGPYDYVEYKYRLEEGAQMQFSWTATAPVIHDLHGELNADPNAVTSFDKSNRRESHAGFTAPFSGLHGWYWENPGGETVTVTLTSTGFYSSAVEFRSDKTKVPHQLSAPKEEK